MNNLKIKLRKDFIHSSIKNNRIFKYKFNNLICCIIPNKQQDIPCSWIGRVSMIKMISSFKLINEFNLILSKFQHTFLQKLIN